MLALAGRRRYKSMCKATRPYLTQETTMDVLGPITQYVITNKQGDIAGPFHAAGQAANYHKRWAACSLDGECSCTMSKLVPMFKPEPTKMGA